jgi:hypothetical protein
MLALCSKQQSARSRRKGRGGPAMSLTRGQLKQSHGYRRGARAIYGPAICRPFLTFRAPITRPWKSWCPQFESGSRLLLKMPAHGRFSGFGCGAEDVLLHRRNHRKRQTLDRLVSHDELATRWGRKESRAPDIACCDAHLLGREWTGERRVADPMVCSRVLRFRACGQCPSSGALRMQRGSKTTMLLLQSQRQCPVCVDPDPEQGDL